MSMQVETNQKMTDEEMHQAMVAALEADSQMEGRVESPLCALERVITTRCQHAKGLYEIATLLAHDEAAWGSTTGEKIRAMIAHEIGQEELDRVRNNAIEWMKNATKGEALDGGQPA